MCGIIGYAGVHAAAPILYRGLLTLEYRGYDSAGIAVLNGHVFDRLRRKGRVRNIASAEQMCGNCGIGHTRWATHGGVTEENAHPHICGKFAVVHNGIIENFLSLKAELTDMGHTFSSETDSEVIAHLLSEYYRDGDLKETLRQTVGRLKGAFALAILCSDYPDRVVCVRQKSPLVIGTDGTGFFVSSDRSGLDGCDRIRYLADGEIAFLRSDRVEMYSFSMKERPLQWIKEEISAIRAAEKEGYAHFMLKEIFETPAAIERTAHGFDYGAAQGLKSALVGAERVWLLGCGTAYHSCMTGVACLERKLKIPCQAEFSGEFLSRRPPIGRESLVIAVSQSGETADTIAAAERAKQKGAPLAVVTNVAHSTLAKMSDYLFLTQAGTEVGVAATKTYAAQLTTFFLLSAFLFDRSARGVFRLPALCRRILQDADSVRVLAKKIASSQNVFFIGRGADYPTALEGSLKLREVSYINGAGYAAGELKHGSIALIDERSTVIALATQPRLTEKMGNAISEVCSRGATVYTLSQNSGMGGSDFKTLPPCPGEYMPVAAAIPLQLLAYYTAVERGLDPDRPRNLAKSVTVQ